jgi:3-oxoacyl-[acyl-carrier-protein] synthase II
LQRLGQYKREPVGNLHLFRQKTRGAIAGEGAAFFFIASKPGEKNYARIDDLDTFYNPEKEDILPRIYSFIERNGKTIQDIDLVVNGINGDPSNDRVYAESINKLFPGLPTLAYKHLCGEYQTASAFGLWLAALILKTGQVPEPVRLPGKIPGLVRNILLYNHYQGMDHSLILVSSV